MTEPKKFSALFTTLHESNALLRDEIDYLGGKGTVGSSSVHNTCTVAKGKREEAAVEGNRLKGGERRRIGVQFAPESLGEILPTNHLIGLQETVALNAIHPASEPESSSLEEISLPLHAAPPPSSQHLSQDTKTNGAMCRPTEPQPFLSSSAEEEESVEGDEVQEEGGNEGKEEEDKISVCSESSDHNYSTSDWSNNPILSPAVSLTSTSSETSRSVSTQSHGKVMSASTGAVAIDRMWDNFSVEEYAPPCKPRERQVKKGKSKQEAWTPQITIPQPFSITVRAKTPRKKSKSMIAAEQERLDRELQEEVECAKRFRALPIPATTYLSPEQIKGESSKQLSKKNIRSSKPFSFLEREKEKRQRKLYQERGPRQKERAFKAKPIPHRVLGSHVRECLIEKEEYRKICIQVRSQDLLASSKMPQNMQTKSVARKEDDYAFVTPEHTFHPKINHEIPDYCSQHSKLQQQLSARKKLRVTTTPQPFHLRTSLIPSRIEQIKQELEQYSDRHRMTSFNSSSGGSSLRSRTLPSKLPYSIQMTEAAKLRQSAIQKKLAEAADAECVEEELKRAKSEHRKQLQRRVSERVQSYDHTALLEEKKRERLQQFRCVCMCVCVCV